MSKANSRCWWEEASSGWESGISLPAHKHAVSHRLCQKQGEREDHSDVNFWADRGQIGFGRRGVLSGRSYRSFPPASVRPRAARSLQSFVVYRHRVLAALSAIAIFKQVRGDSLWLLRQLHMSARR